MPLLQPMALTVDTRRRAAHQHGLLDRLRAQAAATAGGRAVEKMKPLAKLRTKSTRLAEAIGEDKPPRRSNEGDAVHPPG